MSAVVLTGVSKIFNQGRPDEVTALSDIDLTIGDGQFVSLIGPSGCGKSTLLSAVAGLVEPDEGGIDLDGVSLAATPAERRPVSLVFQKPLLFPHLSVEANVGFGLRMAGVARGERRERDRKAHV